MGLVATLWFRILVAVIAETLFALLLYVQVEGNIESFTGHFFPVAAALVIVLFIIAERGKNKQAAGIGLACAAVFLVIGEIAPTTQLRISPEGLLGLGDLRWIIAQFVVCIGACVTYFAVYAWRADPDIKPGSLN